MDDTTAGTGRSVPYRTAFETALDYRDAVDRVREQLRSWLKCKGLCVEGFDAGATTIGPGTVVLYAATNTVSGWQLREHHEDATTWVSTVSVTGRVGQPPTWISVNVEAVGPPERTPPPAAPPKLIRLILDVVDAYDGEAFLRSGPTVVNTSGVEDILELVCAPLRRLPIVVATTPNDVNFDEWRVVIGQVTGSLPGLASIYLLDPAATVAFNEGIGPTHRVGPGAIRTYLPGVDPAITEDAVRHRILSRRRIEDEPRRAARVLAALPRQRAANSLPPAATKGFMPSVRDFTRGGFTTEPGAFPREPVESPSAPDKFTAKLGNELREKLDLYERLLDTASGIEHQLKDTISQQQEELLDLAADLEVARDQVDAHEHTIRTLRRRLAAVSRYQDAFSAPDPPAPLPKSFGEVLDRWGELEPRVIFTGNPNDCLDLDEHPQNSPWAQVAWQALVALADYARAKEAGTFDGDFKHWCEGPGDDGRAISAGKVARDESETVRNTRKYALARTLPVPVTVDPTGRVFMGSHVRLGNSSTVAPRMYFYDATTGRNHVICVGYLGRHLANTLTS